MSALPPLLSDAEVDGLLDGIMRSPDGSGLRIVYELAAAIQREYGKRCRALPAEPVLWQYRWTNPGDDPDRRCPGVC